MQDCSSRNFRPFAVILVIGMLVVSAHATYTVASIKGDFSFLLNKWTADANVGEDAVLGIFHFDGAGSLSGSFSEMHRGVLQTGTATGTYSVNSNGTGTIFLTLPPDNPQIAFVVSSTKTGLAGGLQLLQTNLSGNVVISGFAVLQSTQAAVYTTANLKGTFSFLVNAWTPDVNLSQEGIVGLFTFNGSGKVTGSFRDIHGGVFESGTITGTYTINSDGTGAMSLVTGNDTPQLVLVLNAVAAGHSKGLQLLQTTENGQNRVHSGSAVKE